MPQLSSDVMMQVEKDMLYVKTSHMQGPSNSAVQSAISCADFRQFETSHPGGSVVTSSNQNISDSAAA